MNETHFVGMSEANDGGDVASSHTSALHSDSQFVAWHRHTWRIIILFHNWPWVYLASSKTGSPEREQYIVQPPKMMMAIVWSLTVFTLSTSCPMVINSMLTTMFLQLSNCAIVQLCNCAIVQLCNYPILYRLACQRGRGDWSKTDYACWQCSISHKQGLTDFHRAERDENDAISVIFHRSTTLRSFLFDDIKKIFSNHIFQSADDFLSEIQFILAFMKKFSCWIFLLSECKGWNNIAILMRTKSNDLNNHAFDLSLL
jgi:hypothetical protein